MRVASLLCAVLFTVLPIACAGTATTQKTATPATSRPAEVALESKPIPETEDRAAKDKAALEAREKREKDQREALAKAAEAARVKAEQDAKAKAALTADLTSRLADALLAEATAKDRAKDARAKADAATEKADQAEMNYRRNSSGFRPRDASGMYESIRDGIRAGTVETAVKEAKEAASNAKKADAALTQATQALAGIRSEIRQAGLPLGTIEAAAQVERAAKEKKAQAAEEASRRGNEKPVTAQQRSKPKSLSASER